MLKDQICEGISLNAHTWLASYQLYLDYNDQKKGIGQQDYNSPIENVY